MSLPYEKNLISRARELRSDATKQEKRLWYDFLSQYPVRFQRQKTIDHFIADFYCAKARLVIEIDGAQHYSDDGIAYDEERSAVLEKYGLKILRFSNQDVDRRFSEVCMLIDETVKERMKES